MPKTTFIRCANTKDGGKKCNNLICVMNGDRAIWKRHGREAYIQLFRGQSVVITCERCGRQTAVCLEDREK